LAQGDGIVNALLQPIRRGWMTLVRWLGTAQMIILLSATYWIMVPPVWPFLRFGADPLRLRAPERSNWQPRAPMPEPDVYLKRQF
jgi:hypothetical protein